MAKDQEQKNELPNLDGPSGEAIPVGTKVVFDTDWKLMLIGREFMNYNASKNWLRQNGSKLTKEQKTAVLRAQNLAKIHLQSLYLHIMKNEKWLVLGQLLLGEQENE